jgi:hypothetical protein
MKEGRPEGRVERRKGQKGGKGRGREWGMGKVRKGDGTERYQN